jgi:exosortase
MQTSTKSKDSGSQVAVWVGLLVLLVAFIGVYHDTLARLVRSWWDVPDYVYGFVVVPFSCFLLFDRRDMFQDVTFRWSLWGIPFFALAAAMRLFAAYYNYAIVDSFSIVPMVAGVVVFVGGWPAIRWSWPAICYLAFMVPLPGFVAGMLSQRLQSIGTGISVFTLQTLGMPAVAEGNVIVLTNARLGVVEACSGIRMLMLFFAACVGAALLLRRDLLTRTLIVLSAIPIAVIANVTRLTVTAILYETVSQEIGDKVFHDLAGWFMMPLAIIILWLEVALFDRLFISSEREAPLAFGVSALDDTRE